MKKSQILFRCFLLICLSLPTVASAQNLKDSLLRFIDGAPTPTVNVADTSFSALLNRIDYYGTEFNNISTTLQNGFDTVAVADLLPAIENRLHKSRAYSLGDNLLTIRSLATFQDYFATSQKQLDKWSEQLTKYNNSLLAMQETLCGLTTDTLFKHLPADSALRSKFFARLNSLGPKWQRLDSATNQGLIQIGLLQSRVSATQLDLTDLKEQIAENLKQLNSRVFEKEYPYLWQLDVSNFWGEFSKGIGQTIVFNYRILIYYLKYSSLVHIINMLLFGLLFIWFSSNKNTILRKEETASNIFSNAPLAAKLPLAGSLAVTLTIGIFFYYRPPVALVEIFLILLMACVAILMRSAYPKYLYIWLTLMLFTVLYAFSNLFFEVYSAERILFLLLSLLLLFVSFLAFKKMVFWMGNTVKVSYTYAAYVYLFLIIVGILANLFGRYSLSKTLITTAVFTAVEAVSLLIFVRIITEGIYLQMEAGKIQVNRISSYLDFKNLKDRIGKLLKIIAGVLLLVFFTQNLNVFDSIYQSLKDFFIAQREVGDTKFTFAGFLLFIVIIYLSTVIAQVVSYFFEFADEHSTAIGRKGKYSSSILLVKLSIWTVGFLFAIAASGIPMDRMTIILGALGVGIGFGLQNIANNVVSGLVMVFEKPIQVGDLIEVGNTSGTVRSMGIRASKILTYDGAEVMVPNGDLLSQNLINWTLSDNHKRISLEVGVAYGCDIEDVKLVLKKILSENKDVMKTPEPMILVDGFKESAINFRMLCWVSEIDNWLLIKSVLMSSVFEEFYKNGIEIPFPQRDVNVYFKEKDAAGPGNLSRIKTKVVKPLKED